MEEVWKPIDGYEGIYEVSSFGRIKSLERIIKNSGTRSGYSKLKERILTPRVNKKRHGYYEISLKKNGMEKRYKVHRLVAMAFIPNPEGKPEVNHIDGNKSNNSILNLEWVTSKENKQHAWQTGLANSNHRKRPIKCNETNVCYESVAQAARILHCDRRGIFRVLNGERQSIKNMTFSYITRKELAEYRGDTNE